MGEGILTGTSKGPIHRKIDEVVNHRDSNGRFDKREAFLARLMDEGQDYVDLLQEQAAVTPAEAAYLRATWYNPGQDGWWHTLQPILPIVRAGLIKAVKEASARDLPLDSYWVIGSRHVEVTIAVSPQQVTRILHTPATLPPTRNRTQKVPIWRVTHTNGQPAAQETFDEVIEEVRGNVVTARRKELV